MSWATGWSFDTVEVEFDLPRLRSMFKHWEIFPPLPLLVRRIAVEACGIELKAPAKRVSKNPDDELISMLQQLGGQL